MRKFSIACAAFAIANAWLAPLAAAADPADDAQIRALEARFATAFNAKDVEAVLEIVGMGPATATPAEEK